MIQTTTSYHLDASVLQTFDRAAWRSFENALRRITRARAKPTLASVRDLTPVRTGKLEKSWHLVSYTTPSQGEAGVRIMPREDFSITDRHGNRRLVSAKPTHKVVQKALNQQRMLDRRSPVFYAYPIETGFYADGSRARAKGPARMLQRGLTSNADRFMAEVAADAFAFVTTNASLPGA